MSSTDDCEGIRVGRPYGGLGILWRKSLGQSCNVKPLDDPRLLLLEITLNNEQCLLLLNVYLPYDDGSNLEEYQMYLAKVSSYLDGIYAAAFGDFNGNIISNNHRFGKELVQFCENESLVMSDYITGDKNMVTYYSDSHDTVAWLDHMVSTHNLHSLIRRVWVDNTLVTSDHFPLFVEISLEGLNVSQRPPCSSTLCHSKINWSRMSQDQKNAYVKESSRLLSDVVIDHSLILCDDVSCNDPGHTSAIERLYQGIVSAMHEAGHTCSTQKEKCYKQVADWHEVCAESHTQARDAFHLWCTNGRPRSGPIYQLMKSKRTEFKMAIRKCKEVKEQKESDRLALKLLKGDSEHFWREIRQINARNKPVSLAETVGGVTGVSEISTMWKDHFQALLNSVPSSSLNLSLHDCCFERFTPSEIAEVVSTLKNGKSPGSDQIAAEHVKYAGGRVILLLSLLLNACIIHGFLPVGLMESVIVPIVKNARENISSKDNYRPIALKVQ